MSSVVLVALTWSRDKDPRIPLGHASLLAALQEAQIPVVSVCLSVNAPGFSSAAAVDDILRVAGPDANVWGEQAVQRILPQLRSRGFRGQVVLGGPQISYTAAGLAALYPDADTFIRGYAESALVAVARGSSAPIEGVVRRGGLDLGRQASVSLSALPSPWLSEAVQIPPSGFVRMETQRGCPFRCSFCQHREAGARLSRTSLSSQRVERELVHFVQRGVREIAILDPVFNSGPQSVAVLERLAALGYTGRLSLQCRFEMLTEAFLRACAPLYVTLEFGLQTIHPAEQRAVQRRNKLPKVEEMIARLHAHQIAFEVSLIFALPEQTLRSFQQSVSFCLAQRVPTIKAFPLMLLRGTELERARAQWGLEEDGGTIPSVVASHTFSRAEREEMARISMALQATAGNHPPALGGLLESARTPEPRRWSPREVA